MQLYVWGTGRLTGNVLGKYLDVNRVTAFVDNDQKKRVAGKTGNKSGRAVAQKL